MLASAGVTALGTERRRLTEREYAVADEVFAGTLPSRDDLLLTDAIGAQDRPFTWPERWFRAGQRHDDPDYSYLEGNLRLGKA